MNNQEAAEKMAYHLGFQNKQSKDGNGNCLYRGPNELKCALGCLIPDELYESKFDYGGLGLGWNACGLINYGPEILRNLDEDLLLYFQIIHDSYSPSEWRNTIQSYMNKFPEDVNKEKALEAYDKGCSDRLKNGSN